MFNKEKIRTHKTQTNSLSKCFSRYFRKKLLGCALLLRINDKILFKTQRVEHSKLIIPNSNFLSVNISKI